MAKVLFLITVFALAAIILPTIAQITLTEFQPIVDFPQSCTDAYSQNIDACSQQQDFSSPNTCTAKCIAALFAVQSDIQQACAGVLVDPSSVIGHFFTGTGPAFVCSGIQNSGSPPQSLSTTSQEATTTTVITVTSSSLSTSSMPTSIETTRTSHSTESTKTSSSATSSTETERATSTHTIIENTSTISSSISTKATNVPSFLTTAANQGSATTFTSKAQQTSSSNPDKYGGGGSPFEISANGATSTRAEKGFLLLFCMALLGIGRVLR